VRIIASSSGRPEPSSAIRSRATSPSLNGGLDAVGEHGRPVGVGVAPHVVGDARGDGLAGDRLAAGVRVEDEGNLAVGVPDRLEESEAVVVGELVGADDAVDVVGVEAVDCVARRGLGDNHECVAGGFERGGRFRGHARVLVHAEDGDGPLPSGRHGPELA
jgi:hypothetical protein